MAAPPIEAAPPALCARGYKRQRWSSPLSSTIANLPDQASLAIKSADIPTISFLTPPASPPTRTADPTDSPLGASDPACPTSKLALHVLRTEAAALHAVLVLYEQSTSARLALVACIDAIVCAIERGGKLVVCGVGKSGYIAQKLVATMKSLGVASSFLHATEAVHGDLGDVRENDTVLFITFSGTTPELLTLSHHLPKDITVMALTGHPGPASSCPLLASRPSAILLAAPIPESEEETFGVSAPTTSTTVAAAVGDMLAITVAQAVHRGAASSVFRRNHPGGAIGASAVNGLPN